jgi:hypothetical protein
VCSKLINFASFYSWNACRLHVLYCSHYPHLFVLDPVTIAIWLASFDLTVPSVPLRSIAYVSPICNKLDSALIIFILYQSILLWQSHYTHVSASFDYHRVCMNKTNILCFLLNYVKNGQLFQSYRLKILIYFNNSIILRYLFTHIHSKTFKQLPIYDLEKMEPFWSYCDVFGRRRH